MVLANRIGPEEKKKLERGYQENGAPDLNK
jgi:hypothetical protein